MEFRKGDVVAIEGVVDFQTVDKRKVYVKPSVGESMAFEPAALKMVRRAFLEGDAVEVAPGHVPYMVGKIFALHGEWAWVVAESGFMASHKLDQLRAREVPPPAPKAKGVVPEPSADVVKYTVVEGDTLAGIANSFDTTVIAITSRNKIADPGLIIAGQVLEVQDDRLPF